MREIKYKIYKNKVWREVIYKGVVMANAVAYIGNNKKECEAWLSENK